MCVCVWLGSSHLFKHVWLNNKDTFCLYNFIKILSSFKHAYIYIYIYIYIKIGRFTKRFVYWIYLFILFLHTCRFPACCFRLRTYMAQGLVNGVVNETWTYSRLEFEWFSVGYRHLPLFFLECVHLSLLYPSLIFDMFLSCVCVCVCVCVGVLLDFTNSYFSSVCV